MTLHRVSPSTGQPEVHPEVLHGATSFLAGEERLQAGLKATAESFFGLFADPLVAEKTGASDFRLADLMCWETPVTLYLQPPPSDAARLMPLTQPPDPGRLFGDSARLSFWLGVGGQGPLS